MSHPDKGAGLSFSQALRAASGRGVRHVKWSPHLYIRWNVDGFYWEIGNQQCGENWRRVDRDLDGDFPARCTGAIEYGGVLTPKWLSDDRWEVQP